MLFFYGDWPGTLHVLDNEGLGEKMVARASVRGPFVTSVFVTEIKRGVSREAFLFEGISRPKLS